MFDFKIVDDTGITTYICASCRKEAIQIYCNEKCVDADHIKKHCIIKNMGGVSNGKKY
jgi:hypothetical protein